MLTIGTTIMLEVKQSNTTDKYKCKLLDIRGNKLYIDYPLNEQTRKFGIFIEGTRLKASFIGKDDGLYHFETIVIGRKKEGNIPMVVLDNPGNENLGKVQRREFVRVETAIDVAIHPIHNEFQPFTAITSDISAGGSAIILPKSHKLKGQMYIRAWFVLPLAGGEYHYLKTMCKVIRILTGENVRDKAPLQFIDLKEPDKQIITRLCFERQLATRKKWLNE